MSNTESSRPTADAKAESTPNLRVLLALVIFMGILIVAGLVVVGVTIAVRLSGMDDDETPAAKGGFEIADIPVPAGCEILETQADEDRLIVRLGLGGRCNQLIVIDLRSGAVTGRLNFVPTP